MSAALIWSPFESEDTAAAAASQLLDERLIVCANLFPGMRSLYQWRGERGDARECGALFKTDARLLDKAVARLAAIHPYETPAIAGWRADAAAPASVAWLGELV
ncbi:MAG TPA: divalent-cation tolerance protein CutA [Croceibacterium sp.]|jgi:periplasmic divalent cation tolerance protein